jgi:hypothetical protein
VPFQNNTNYNVEPQNGTQRILNIQPVIPMTLDKYWNPITRTIYTEISQPAFAPTQDHWNGVGDVQVPGFLRYGVPITLCQLAVSALYVFVMFRLMK